jgi:hypothetical protein
MPQQRELLLEHLDAQFLLAYQIEFFADQRLEGRRIIRQWWWCFGGFIHSQESN